MSGTRRPVIGIYDYSYPCAHYSLGDTLTWTMNLNVLAAEAGADALDEYLVINPARPSSYSRSSTPTTT